MDNLKLQIQEFKKTFSYFYKKIKKINIDPIKTIYKKNIHLYCNRCSHHWDIKKLNDEYSYNVFPYLIIENPQQCKNKVNTICILCKKLILSYLKFNNLKNNSNPCFNHDDFKVNIKIPRLESLSAYVLSKNIKWFGFPFNSNLFKIKMYLKDDIIDDIENYLEYTPL